MTRCEARYGRAGHSHSANWPVAMAVIAVFACAISKPALAQTPATPAPEQQSPLLPTPGSKLWIVGGGGFSMTRAGCSVGCSHAGVFTNSKGLFFDIGGRVNPRVDVGVELLVVRGRIEADQDPVLTTFVLGIGQFRPWLDRGLYLRAGMGVGFAGNGIYSPFGPALAPPYTTNALGLSYGIGWIFRRERRVTLQAAFSHHIAALGELATVTGETVKNVVGNYWTSGMAIVIR